MTKLKKEEINILADSLKSRMEGINGWISQNPNTDPNFYEITDCLTSASEIISYMRQYYDTVGYPQRPEGTSEADSIKNHVHYEITAFDEHAKACWDELNKMLRSRGIIGDKSATADGKPSFYDNEEPHEFLTELIYRGWSGDYEVLEHPFAGLKKEVLW